MIQEPKEPSNSKEKNEEKPSAKVQGLAKIPKKVPQTTTDINYKAALNSIDQSKKEHLLRNKKRSRKKQTQTKMMNYLSMKNQPMSKSNKRKILQSPKMIKPKINQK